MNDALMVISFVDGKFSQVTSIGIIRSALEGSFKLPLKPANVTHIYLFMASRDREEHSESICIEV